MIKKSAGGEKRTLDLRPGCPARLNGQRVLLQRVPIAPQASKPVGIDGTCGGSHLPPQELQHNPAERVPTWSGHVRQF